MPKRKHKSGATKRNEKKRANQLIESQRGAINKYFSATTSVDVHGDNQRQESDPEQDDDQSLSADHVVDEQPLDDSKSLTSIDFLHKYVCNILTIFC
jgi:hypothetical protein